MEDLEARKQRLAALTGGDKPSPAGRSKADLARRRRRLSQTAGLQTQQSREKEVSVATSGTGGSLPTDRTYNLGKCTICYSCSTHPGNDPGGMQKTNQDSWLVRENFGEKNMLLMGVYDGHGYEGEKVSRTIVSKLPGFMNESKEFITGNLREAFKYALPACNKSLKNSGVIETSLSGSTAVQALLYGDKSVLCANVGDSRAIVGVVESNGKTSVVELSHDHKPTNPEEQERIESNGGRVEPYMYEGEAIGPPRVWLRDEDTPGLCMSRSIGDSIAASVGVIADPDLVEHEFGPQDKYLVFMSDGIFEFISNEEVIEFIHKHAQQGLSPREVGKRLVKEARKKWQEEEEDIIDDCTAMVAYLTVEP